MALVQEPTECNAIRRAVATPPLLASIATSADVGRRTQIRPHARSASPKMARWPIAEQGVPWEPTRAACGAEQKNAIM